MTWAERFWNLLTQDLGLKAISIVIAVVLWIVVLGSRPVEVTKEVPIEIITAPELMVSNEVPDRVSFRLSGPKAFLRAIRDRREEAIRVDLTGNRQSVVNYKFFSDNIRLPIGVKVLSVNPPSIVARLETVRRKEVPVRLEFRGAPKDGLQIVRSEPRPPTVRIKGPESKIESVREVRSLPIELGDLTSTGEFSIRIDDDSGRFALEGVDPHAYVELATAGGSYRIRNVDIKVLTAFSFKTDPGQLTVLVKGRAPDQTLDRRKIYGLIDLRGKPKGKYRETVKMVIPTDMTLIKTQPDTVNVTVF